MVLTLLLAVHAGLTVGQFRVVAVASGYAIPLASLVMYVSPSCGMLYTWRLERDSLMYNSCRPPGSTACSLRKLRSIREALTVRQAVERMRVGEQDFEVYTLLAHDLTVTPSLRGALAPESVGGTSSATAVSPTYAALLPGTPTPTSAPSRLDAGVQGPTSAATRAPSPVLALKPARVEQPTWHNEPGPEIVPSASSPLLQPSLVPTASLARLAGAVAAPGGTDDDAGTDVGSPTADGDAVGALTLEPRLTAPRLLCAAPEYVLALAMCRRRGPVWWLTCAVSVAGMR